MKSGMSAALLAAFLMTGSASMGFAASQIDLSGFYRAYYISDHDSRFTKDGGISDSYFAHRFQMDVNFQATDEVSVHWRFRAPDFRRWGYRETGGSSFTTRHIYGQVVQDWGSLAVGRLMEGADEFGLSSLGWVPALDTHGIFTSVAPFEDGEPNDGIRFWRSWDSGFHLSASYAKVLTNFPDDESHLSRDHDWDRYQAEGRYHWENGGAALNVIFERDATPNPQYGPTLTDAPARLDKNIFWYLNPAVMHSWGPLSVHLEGKFGWGKTRYLNNPSHDEQLKDLDSRGQGLYADLDYNYGPGRVNLAGWWVSGSKMNERDSHSLVDMGANFYPLVVAYGDYTLGQGRVDKGYGDWQANGSAIARANIYTNLVQNGWNKSVFLNPVGSGGLLAGTDLAAVDAPPVLRGFKIGAFRGQNYSILTNLHNEERPRSNHWAVALSGQHFFTEEIMVHYGVAYLALNHPNYRVATGARSTIVPSGGVLTREYSNYAYHTQDKDLGWEVDFGLGLQLLDNLYFTSVFGYMFTGDAYKQLEGYAITGNAADGYQIQAKWKDSKDAYTWMNALTFSF